VAPDGTVVLISFALSWASSPVCVGAWKQLRYGVGVWLAWICYGELAIYRKSDAEPDYGAGAAAGALGWSTVAMLASAGWLLAAVLVLGGRKETPGTRYIDATVVVLLTACLFFPVPDSSFRNGTCACRVTKAAVFSALFSFMFLCDRRAKSLETHAQRATVTTAWTLMATSYALPAAVVQVLWVCHLNKLSFSAAAYDEGRAGATSSDDDCEAGARDEEPPRGPEPPGAAAAAGPPRGRSEDAAALREALAAQAPSTSTWRGMAAPVPLRASQSDLKAGAEAADVARLVAMSKKG
jgi:hypothetical protein